MEIFPKESITKQGVDLKDMLIKKGNMFGLENAYISRFLYNNNLFLNFYT